MKDYVARTNPWPYPFTIKDAQGTMLYTKENGAMFDMACGIAVNNLGHNFEKIKEVSKKTIDKYAHTMVYGEFYIEEQLVYAEALAERFSKKSMANGTGDENRVWFTTSGTEANELAIKLATLATGRKGFIALKGGFHGRSLGSLSITYKPLYREPFAHMLSDGQTEFIEPGEEIPESFKGRAAFFMELVQGEAGVIPIDPKWAKYVSDWCHENGVLLVIDEVQTGMGRTGYQFALDYYKDVFPDIVTLGKAAGAGYPLGAVVSSVETFDSITIKNPFTHLSTFGGNPIGCAAGKVMFDVTGTDALLSNVHDGYVAAYNVFKNCEYAEIRGMGLMLGLVLKDGVDIDRVVENIWSNRVFCGRVLYANNTIRLYPPLNSDFYELYNAFERVLDAVKSSVKG
jgi:acetylornithine/succinyldiaminopimelate/putrescine aminotransferase